MKALVIFIAVIAAAVAKPKPHGEHLVHVRQDTLGNYISYGINGLSRVEQHSLQAIPVLRTVAIVPEERAVLTVRDTPELTLAKAEHLNIQPAAALPHVVSKAEVPVVQIAETPIVRSHVNAVPITYTPEVVQVAATPQLSAVVAPETRHVLVY